ncbi:MAG TPA: hypothetical protein VG755_35650 [Nannocystaceae bacterium]|nr:hypothetical protein [Nannocystaceae bacterium]
MGHVDVVELEAIVRPDVPPLSREDCGAWLWTHLRAAFRDALAAVLLPDRARLVVAARDVDLTRVRLARLLGQLGRVHGVAGRPTREVVARSIEGDVVERLCDVVVAPCRAKLVVAPLAWPWSTHRDVVGAIVDPWVSAERLATLLQVSPRGFAARHHARVTTRAGRASALPIPAPYLPTLPLRTIAIAAASATRASLGAIRQRGPTRATFVALAREYGWTSTRKLAEVCGCTQMTIRSLAANADELALSSARLCLGDDDLLRLPQPPPPVDEHGR